MPAGAPPPSRSALHHRSRSRKVLVCWRMKTGTHLFGHSRPCTMGKVAGEWTRGGQGSWLSPRRWSLTAPPFGWWDENMAVWPTLTSVPNREGSQCEGPRKAGSVLMSLPLSPVGGRFGCYVIGTCRTTARLGTQGRLVAREPWRKSRCLCRGQRRP